MTLQKIEKAMVLALVAIALSFATIAPGLSRNAVAADTQGSVENGCSDDVILAKIHAIQEKIDNAKAKALASSDGKFQAARADHNAQFENLSTTWSADESTCEVTLDGVHLLYSLKDGQGNFVRNIMVNQDKNTSKVESVEEQDVTFFASYYTPVWSGYEIRANSAGTTPVYIAKTTYNIPAISQPYSGACTSNKNCDVAVWTGLADALGASNNHLAQAGTVSTLTSGTGTPIYKAWYEFLPAAAVFAPGTYPVAAGNPMEIRVINNAYNGGSSSSYEIYMKMVSGSSNHYWISPGIAYSDMTSPKYADYMVERPYKIVNGSPVYSTLGKFSAFSIGGEMWYSGGYNGITTPYNAGYWDKDIMRNPPATGTINTSVGSVSSSSTFTETWLSSNGT